MLKPTSAFVYIFQDASISEEGACVEPTAVLEEGDCVLPANVLQDSNSITKIRNRDSFLTLRLLEKCFGVSRPTVCVDCNNMCYTFYRLESSNFRLKLALFKDFGL